MSLSCLPATRSSAGSFSSSTLCFEEGRLSHTASLTSLAKPRRRLAGRVKARCRPPACQGEPLLVPLAVSAPVSTISAQRSVLRALACSFTNQAPRSCGKASFSKHERRWRDNSSVDTLCPARLRQRLLWASLFRASEGASGRIIHPLRTFLRACLTLSRAGCLLIVGSWCWHPFSRLWFVLRLWQQTCLRMLYSSTPSTLASSATAQRHLFKAPLDLPAPARSRRPLEGNYQSACRYLPPTAR